MLFKHWLTFLYLPFACLNFSFKQLTVGPTSSIIGTVTTYDIIYERSITNTNSITNFSGQAVPAGSVVTVTFPNDYVISSPTCLSVSINSVTVSGFTCTTSGNTITLSGAIPSALFIDRIQWSLGNILNPVPAIYTGQFNGIIGNDVSVPVGTGVQLVAAAFDSCSITFDTAIVNQTSTMVLTLDPKNSLSTSATILISTPRRWSNDILATSSLPVTASMSCVNYSTGVTATPTCAGNTVLYTITASNVLTATTTSSFSFGVRSFVSPPTLQPSDSFTITSYSGSYQVDTCTAFVSGLIANTFTSILITPLSTMTVNTNVGLRIDLTLADFCNEFDDLQITFPSEIAPTFVNVSGSGLYNTTISGVSGQVLTVGNRKTISKLYARGSVYTLNFYQIKAPPSTKTTSTITIKLLRNGFQKMTGTTTIQAVSSTLTGTVSPTLSTVNQVTTYAINVVITDGLAPNGMVKIAFPSTITLTGTTGCATLTGTSVRSNPTCVYDSSTNSILISSMNSSSANIPAQTLRFVISGVRNPPSVNPSGSFTVTTYYTTDTSGIVSTGTLSGITATLDIIDASTVTVVPSSYVVSDTSVTYTLSFVLGNSIPQNGYGEITIPSGIILDVASLSTYCTMSLNGGSYFSTTCAGVNTGSGYYVNFSSLAQSSTIVAGTIVALRISSIFTNPADTSVVSTFTIKTYHSDTYGIEQLTTGISVQMTTASTFTLMTVTRTSDTNSDATSSYTFRLKQTPNLPASARLRITYPSTLTLSSSTTCASLTSVTLTCVQSTGSIEVQLTSAVSSATEFGVTLSNILNPPSFAPLTSAFSFLTRSSDRLLSYATGSVITNLQNSVASSFSSLSGQFSSRIYGQATNLQVTVTPSSRIVPTYMVVTLANSLTGGSLSCTSWSCVGLTSSTIRINNITSTAQISFTITGITAPRTAPSDYTMVSSYDSGGYLIDQNTNTIIFSVICTMPCRTCSSTNSSACLTCYSDTTITTSIYLYSTTSQCYSTCPSNTYIDSSTSRCTDCNSNCLTCVVTSTNCTSCVSSSSFPYLFINSSTGNCRSLCPTLYYPDTTQSPVLCVLCVSPCRACTSLTQCTSCADGWYFYNNTCSTSCPSGTTIANSVTDTCDACSVQCATCSGTVSNCIGCATGAALYNGTCVSVCPSPLVIYNGQCVTCSTNCLTCSLTYSNCTSCLTTGSVPYLYNNVCLADCPELYYQSISNGRCILCSTLNLGCDNCTSTSTCGTCNWVQGYVFLNNRCFSTTPTGYYNSSGYALACDNTANCATCLNLAQNCTACISLNLEGNLCVATCRAGFVGINQICVACTGNCRTCSNLQSNCTSCITTASPAVYLSNFQCLTSCPDYTYQNTITNECTSCSSPCEKCFSASSCETCLLGFFLVNNSCPSVCPYGYFGVNRVCVRCTSPCDACSVSLTVCTACVTGYYLVTTTSLCTTTCPTGLYPNDVTGSCTGCVSPCVTCSTTASTCTSCETGLNLLNNTCITTCPDGYYQLNSLCNACNVNCTRCTSSSVCQSCVVNLFLYNDNCISSCPTNLPVTTTGTCTACTDANCLICDSRDQCTSCNFPTLLLLGDCLTSCPTDYVSNSTHCNYSPTSNTTNTTDTTTNTTLNSTLSSTNLFPVPFTIAGSFIGIACIMSKFQHPYTFIAGALYSLWSVLEWGSIGVGGFLYYLSNKDSIAFTTTYIQAFVFLGAVGLMYLLNLLALISQTCYLRGQQAFRRWQEKQGSNSCFYTFSSIFGAIITHKFKNIMFCKLFGFDIFKARLNNIQSFRIFNIFSFLSILPSAAILFSTSYMIYKHHTIDQELMGYIDVLVLTTFCIILSIFNSRKDQDFFEEKDQDGIIINKRIIQSDSIMQEAIIPFMADDAMQQRGGNMKNPKLQSERRFKSFQKSYQTISDAPPSQQESFNYIIPAKSVHNISIQAAPVLQDYSKIDFYNDEELSEVSMFKKVDKSINMTKQFNVNDISVQNDMNIFDQKQVSIQQNPQQEDISIQHQIDVRDISLQNAPNMDDHGMQMSRHDEDHSIQVGVLVNNASVQYSAKPIFQDVSQDFIDQEQQLQQFGNASRLGNQLTGTQKPSDQPQGLKAELQLDVDEKLRQRQQQMQRQRQQQIARKKQQMLRRFHQEQQRQREKQQQMLRKFHQQQQKKLLEKEVPVEREDHFANINNINNKFNNQYSRPDGDSLMDSDANIMLHVKNSTKNIIQPSDGLANKTPSKQITNKSKSRQPQQERQERLRPQERAQSAKTEKQLIQLLSNNNNNQNHQGLDLQSSMSFNVTRDLQSGNQNGGRRIKNVVYQEQDKNMDSGEQDQVQLQQPERDKKKQVYVLQNDSNEQIPSGIQKSRSTNFLSTNGRRPPLPNRGGSRFLDDTMNMQNSKLDQYEQINYHPIKPVARNFIPTSNYKEEDLDYQAKTNINQFFNRRKNNPISAHQFGIKNNVQNLDSDQLASNSKQIKQNPLPLPKIQRLRSQQSNHSNDNSQRLYKMNNRKALLQDRKLQFDDQEKIDLDDFESQQRLPPVSGLPEPRLRKIKSQSKMAERDNSYQKPAHRQLLGKDRYVDRTQRFLEKQYKKAQSTKKKIQMMEVMLQRPNLTSEKGYLKETYSSQDKKKRSQLQKVYMNNPFEKRV